MNIGLETSLQQKASVFYNFTLPTPNQCYSFVQVHGQNTKNCWNHWECSFKKLWCFDLILLWTRCPVTLLCWLQLYWLSSDNSQALGSWKFCTRRLEGWRCQKLQVCPPNFYTCKHFVSLCVRAEARTWSGPKRRVRGSEWSEQELYSDVVTAIFTSAKARSEARVNEHEWGILWT